MNDKTICKSSDPDYFLVESSPFGNREELLEMGLDMHLTFHGDGTVEAYMGVDLAGTWSGETMRLSADEEEAVNYIIASDGDFLTITGVEDEGGGDIVFRRSNLT